jgi:CHAT domain-containing protein
MIIIPDEELFNVSFNAIRMANDSFLIEKKEIAVLSSVNDLIGKKDSSLFKISSSTNVLIYGAINYAEKDTSDISSFKNLEKDSEPYFVLKRNSKFKLNYLPGTLEEISSVSNLLAADNVKFQIVKGDDAKEEKFYEYIIDKSPAILHFATHGYFLDDSVKTIESEDININKSLMQNGIFLSNSQKTWDKGIIGYDKSDGIINGLEIASTNLSNTELVVLSACNSGRGRIINREGVYGLQKGFKLAGAKSILYTLWPIPDKETVDFITKYYKHLLEEKNTSLAYRKTVLELLLLDQYRATPSIWAGFVLVN